MTFCLSAPSKTFLAGEYAVLQGAPALVLNTGPRFELRVRAGEGTWSGIPSGSPADRWLHQRSPLLQKYHLEFCDPHGSRGGFGASGAQFLMAHAATTFMQSSFSAWVQGVDLKAAWSDLHVLSAGRGSGADLLAQAVGSVAEVNVSARSAQAKPWPYPELDFCILRTGNKIPTHEHLSALKTDELGALVGLAEECAAAFAQQPGAVFVEALGSYSHALRELGLLAEASAPIVDQLERQNWCLAAKGCGALGADTVLFVFRRESEAQVEKFLASQGWLPVARVRDLTAGLRIEWRSDAP